MPNKPIMTPKSIAPKPPNPEPRAGRPRSERAHNAILGAAFKLILEEGFRAVSLESIAAKAGVAKTTVYRRWPNKAAIVMDAFTAKAGSGSLFPAAPAAIESIRLQMHAMARSFRGNDGVLIKALLAEAQFDPELANALRTRWTLPRRKLATGIIRQAIQQGDIRPELTPDDVIDLLYAPIYYRLQRGTGSLSHAYIERIFHHAMQGLAPTGLTQGRQIPLRQR
jgi:AcrR family transcriptional regulator